MAARKIFDHERPGANGNIKKAVELSFEKLLIFNQSPSLWLPEKFLIMSALEQMGILKSSRNNF